MVASTANLQAWLQNLLIEIKNILQILILVSFNIGLAAYVLPEKLNEISPRQIYSNFSATPHGGDSYAITRKG